MIKVNDDGLVNQTANALDKGPMSRIGCDVIVPIFARGEFDNETMCDSTLAPD